MSDKKGAVKADKGVNVLGQKDINVKIVNPVEQVDEIDHTFHLGIEKYEHQREDLFQILSIRDYGDSKVVTEVAMIGKHLIQRDIVVANGVIVSASSILINNHKVETMEYTEKNTKEKKKIVAYKMS